ncbi:hypothetical protein N7536_005568 [Penicillium majusculum]|nr:hypothetical protein N7536_005568 [Penicillium majusculum]
MSGSGHLVFINEVRPAKYLIRTNISSLPPKISDGSIKNSDRRGIGKEKNMQRHNSQMVVA